MRGFYGSSFPDFFAGHESALGKRTSGRILLENGYATSWFGKDHNTPTYTASQVGPFDQWPTGMGFEYFYGFVGGDANQWQPNSQSSGTSLLASIQTVAPSLRVEVNPINMRDAGEIERAVTAFARSPGGGLVVVASPAATRHRDLIIKLAARHKLPAVYYERFFVAGGGLISYGTDFVDQYRRAAGYVDRILKGEKPADLPVQAATKYQLVINLKTAKALGLTIPPSVLARADEVIE